MTLATINLTIDTNFLEQIDAVATNESRTRTDLICNSVKMYIDRKKRLQELFAYGEHVASENDFTENDIMDEIKQYRKNK
jgi:metal-responsive CopG/Arc/MetJ family transcriptional regulator